MGGKSLALVAATFLLAVGAFGCVESTDSSDSEADVTAAQSALDIGDGVDVDDVSYAEGSITVDGSDVKEDPEPSPWEPPGSGVIETSGGIPVGPGDPEASADPEPAPWVPNTHHGP